MSESGRIVPRCPSAAAMVAAKICDADQAKAVRKRIKQGFVRGMCHVSHDVAAFLADVNKIGGWHGVESLYDQTEGLDGGKLAHVWYLNAGDTYQATLLFSSESMCFRIGCWGDVAERGRYGK